MFNSFSRLKDLNLVTVSQAAREVKKTTSNIRYYISYNRISKYNSLCEKLNSKASNGDLRVSLLSNKIDTKLMKYSRESKAMPFLTKLMQDNEKVAAYSYIHSLATTLGMSIYEQTAKILAEPNCEICQTGYDVGGVISKEQKSTIGNIVRELRNEERKCSISEEKIEVLRCDSRNGKSQKDG